MVLYTGQADAACCEYDADVEMLRAIPVFSELPLDFLRAYAYLCERIRFQEGEYLFRQNERDSRAYLVVSGTLEAVRETDSGVLQAVRQRRISGFAGAAG
jgi:CRP-like cAMP-binding protein